MKFSTPVFLCSPKRSPIGGLGGSIASLSAVEIGVQVVQAVLRESGVPVETVEEAIFGCVLSAGVGQAPARQIAIKSGLSHSTQSLTVNKVCSSGLKALAIAAEHVQLGISQSVIAGGMESMSQAPYLLPALRHGARLGATSAEDSIIKDGLWDVYNNFHMGNAAELCATEFKLTREAQDAYAKRSFERAIAAGKNGFFSKEIVPLEVRAGKNILKIEHDEGPTKFQPEKMAQLKPVFDKTGTVTAANASSISDGGAAMLVCSEKYVSQHRLKPLARIVAQGWNGQAPEWFTTAPIGAIEHVLSSASLTVKDIDLFEINEAFSAVALACSHSLKLDAERVNVSGGAVALGHPIGASGARIVTTLAYALERLKLKRGIASICNGGGEATALLIELT